MSASTATTTETPSLGDIYPFARFATIYEKQGLGTEFSLRWLIRFRRQNGLMASGAVIEKRTPGSSRPRIFINAPRFAVWLATSDTAGRAA